MRGTRAPSFNRGDGSGWAALQPYPFDSNDDWERFGDRETVSPCQRARPTRVGCRAPAFWPGALQRTGTVQPLRFGQRLTAGCRAVLQVCERLSFSHPSVGGPIGSPAPRAMYVSSRVTSAVSPAPVGNSAPLREAEGAPAGSSRAEAKDTHLSGPAQLMSKLAQLRDSAPAQFTQVVSGLAADLRDVAARDTGMSAKMLTALASRLDGLASSRESLRPAGSTAATAYRSNATAEVAGSDTARAALARMMDDLDAALKASASRER